MKFPTVLMNLLQPQTTTLEHLQIPTLIPISISTIMFIRKFLTTKTIILTKFLKKNTTKNNGNNPDKCTKNNSEEISDDFDREIEENNSQPTDLISCYGVEEDLNRAGLVRSKKTDIAQQGKKKVYQMEDTNYCAYPFDNNQNVSLFCVFDGHAGKKMFNRSCHCIP